MQLADEVVGENLLRRERPFQHRSQPIGGDLRPDRLLQVIHVGSADRITDHHTDLLRQGPQVFLGDNRLAVLRVEGHQALCAVGWVDSKNSSTSRERT